MIASIRDSPCWAARTTDSGVPPTPIQVGSAPEVVCGKTSMPSSAGRNFPVQVTGFSSRSWANRSAFSANSSS